jgi:SAM-dependent methyltransferase
VSDPRVELVGRGYDAMIDTWEGWVARIDDDPRQELAADLASRLTDGARVLELGCGGGTRETRDLARRFRLTGVDVSPRQLERARERVPEAAFVLGDFTALDFDDASFEAVVAFYSWNHVPRELLPGLLDRIRTWLVPGGWLLSAFGTIDEEGWTGDFLGAPSFFSSFPPARNSELVAAAGFAIERDEIVEIREPEGPQRFQWILARS